MGELPSRSVAVPSALLTGMPALRRSARGRFVSRQDALKSYRAYRAYQRPFAIGCVSGVFLPIPLALVVAALVGLDAFMLLGAATIVMFVTPIAMMVGSVSRGRRAARAALRASGFERDEAADYTDALLATTERGFLRILEQRKFFLE